MAVGIAALSLILLMIAAYRGMSVIVMERSEEARRRAETASTSMLLWAPAVPPSASAAVV